MKAVTVCLVFILLSGCGAFRTVTVPVREIADCPNPWPPKLCGDMPAPLAEDLSGLVEYAASLRAWGTACRSETMAWRQAAADCREESRR